MKAVSVMIRRSLLSGILMFYTICYTCSQVDSKSLELISHAAIVSSASKLTSESGSISFANAFQWNRSGPTGGYWSENESNDNILRPVFTNINKYRLQVFNRNGFKIYESNDLYKGWDGYLKNGQPAMQGVYVWIVTGTYSDSTPFSKIGDVTFLH